MRKFCCVVLLTVACYGPALGTTWYVRSTATGTASGTSWADAFTTIQAAISATTLGDTVWVANGTYKPTATTSRSISFAIPSGVKFYGGFTGTETLLSQRNYTTYQTILSGDIGQGGLQTDNSYHVVTFSGATNQTRLDGFKIINGYANGSSSSASIGGGICVLGYNPTVANCFLAENHAIYGGGLYYSSSAAGTIVGCTFLNNSSTRGAGMTVSASNSSLLVSDCNLSGNISTSNGAAFEILSGDLTVDRCVISGNSSGAWGGAFILDFAALKVVNTLIVGNVANYEVVLEQDNSNPYPVNFFNCTIAHNKNAQGGSYLFAFRQTNQMRNSIIWGNAASALSLTMPVMSHDQIQSTLPVSTPVDTSNPLFVSPATAAVAPFLASGYDYHLGLLSSAIDTGSNAFIQPLQNMDLDGAPRSFGISPDLGAYEKNFCTFSPTTTPAGPVTLCPAATLTLTASGGVLYRWNTGASSSGITVTTGGVYKVFAANAAGCRGVSQIPVTASPGTLTILSLPPANGICQGTSKLITASGAALASFSWAPGPPTADNLVSNPGKYVVTAITNDGCVLKDSIEMITLPLPQPLITWAGTGLSTSSFSAYQWQHTGNDIPGATAQFHQPAANGTYTVRVTNSNGCVNVSPPVLVNNVGLSGVRAANWRIAPNPAQSECQIEGPDAQVTSLTCVIRDVAGRVVLTETLNKVNGSNFFTLSLGNIPAGLYSVTLTAGAMHTSRLLLKQ